MPDRPRILCVDDEKLNRTIVHDMLDSARFLVIEAESGEEALSILEDHAVDIILLDVNMPGIDGFEVCRRIKASDKLRHIPVIMITALTETEDRIRGIEAGAEDYINKPFNEGEVLARCERQVLALGLTTARVATLFDVDTLDDLRRWRAAPTDSGVSGDGP